MPKPRQKWPLTKYRQVWIFVVRNVSHKLMDGQNLFAGNNQGLRLLPLVRYTYSVLSCSIIIIVEHYFVNLASESHLNLAPNVSNLLILEQPCLVAPFKVRSI